MRFGTLSFSILVLGAAVGCDLKTSPSNFADGGACTAPALDAGSATLTGTNAFSVVSAVEWLNAPTNDAGGSSILGFELSSHPADCGGPVRDGGAPLSAVALGNLFNTVPGTFAPGDYAILAAAPLYPSAPVTPPAGADGGYASLGLEGLNADGGFYVLNAQSGTFHLTAIANCSISGSFTASFATDGGAPLSGSFDALYCAQH